MHHNKQQTLISQASLMLAFLAGSSLVAGQFLPQSHLGRLVQSITSPLMLGGSGGNGDSGDQNSPDGYSNQAGYYPGQDEGPEVQSQAQARPQSIHGDYNRHQGLQQAPSQQRGIPQRYYENDDNGGAPSNNKGTHESYQMGAYLGPTVDDKEINGAFNSNDDRDDDDGPAGYDAGLGGSGGRQGGDSAGYAPGHVSSSASSGYERRPIMGGGQQANYGNDEDGADEDDAPMERGRGGGARGSNGGGLNQAASQYRQQGSAYNQQAYGQPGQANMMVAAAANGYGPSEFNGPVDLTGMMGGNQGQDMSGYQAYNGDGSYPGSNYYQQQGQPQRGNRNQAASMNNGYYNNQNGVSDGRQPKQANQNDNDDHENEADDD